ncbi:Arabinogalactan endo-1,4-beta-galactosidase [Fibrobacter sp. UWT2]|uniref:glycosyl hydrolase 53 family protein n=1 Tax=Fibrobacter sp. UWT2 TaxID=1896224 RepID=UPI00091DC740|nr:glycosyl hydrolase 53 family protein [Fibrobacter sp. UWT2]SHL76473.1 Arabinogalactan endo-1,4-beta-galactosidase [Fibrobacter sp. UWT2]
MFGMGKIIRKTALALGAVAVAALARPYIVGVDVSWVLEDESLGATYYDDGKKQDLFDILQNNGINFIRVRTFVNSCIGYAKESYSGANSNVCWCDLEHTIALAKRIKAHNMGFFLDFHMSDTWASIGHQDVPASWAGKGNAEMGKLAYNHVKTTMDALMKAGLRPDMVQVGNEINSKVAGVSMSKMADFANIINSGVKAVRETDPSIKIVMQHGQPRPEKGFADWYNKIHANIDYDAICGSTYGTTNNGQDWRDMFGLVIKNKKPVLSCEYTGERTALVNSVFYEFGDLGWGTFVWEPTRYSKKPMFDRDGQKYTANARLKELRDIAKKYAATLPDWVQNGKTVKKYNVKTTVAYGGSIAQSIEGSEIAEGSKVTFTAVPQEGWEFVAWTGDNTGNGKEYTVASLGKDVNLGATFKFVGKDSLKYEAENGVFNKTVLESTHEGFSGKGYANLDNEVGSSVTLSVVTAGEGDKDVKIVFANGSTANRPVSVAVNGKVQVESVDFESTGAWESWDSSVVTLKLPAGASTITIASLTKDGGPNIDRVEFVRADSGTTVLQRIPVRSNAFRNGSRNFLVNGRSAGALKNHASKIKIYSK